METQEYRKLKDSEKKTCKDCKLPAKYRIGTKNLCTMHAKSESLKLITEQEEEL